MTSDVRICSSCGEENPHKAKFCLECGTKLPVDLLEELPQEATGAIPGISRRSASIPERASGLVETARTRTSGTAGFRRADLTASQDARR